MFQREKAQVLLVYPLILLITWAQQVPMSHEYDLLLQTFLNNEGMDEAHLPCTTAWPNTSRRAMEPPCWPYWPRVVEVNFPC